MIGFRCLLFVKELCVNIWYTLTMDLSVSIIDNDYELDRILKRILDSTNLDGYASLLTCQWSTVHGHSSHKNTGVGMAPNLDTGSANFGAGPCELEI